MGVVDGSIHWNGQNNFFDFIQFAAEKAGMTREEYIATYGFPHKTESVEIEENKKKPGPDPYHRGLDDEEVEDKEAQIKKQAKMDDDDPDAYKEMPGDKEAREKGEVKTSKATKAYNKLYGEDLDEGVMGDLHQMANEIGDEDKFVKAFFKEYGDKVKKSKDSEDWVRSLYRDTIQESLKTQKLQKELSKVETWVRKSELDYDDWDWDGEELTIFTKDGTEKYSKKDLKDEGVFESKVNEISNKNAEKYSQPLRKLKNPKKIRNIAAGRGKYDDMLVWLSHNAKNLDYHLDGQGQLHVNGEDYEMVRTELGESIVSEGQVLLFDELNDDFEALSTKISNLADRAVDPNWKKALDKMYKQLDRLIDIAANQDNRLGAIDTNESVSEVNHTGSEASDKMAFSQLERIIDYATMIRDRMAAGKGLDAWMYGKVIKAEDYLNTLYDVIDGDDGVVETQKMNKKDWKKIKPFNKHITKDGEKFVMSYDDRIGTFLEPVEIVDEANVKNLSTAELRKIIKQADDERVSRSFAMQVKAAYAELKRRGESISEAKRGDIHRAAKKGNYPVTIIATRDGEVVRQETVNTPMQVPAAFNVIQFEESGQGGDVKVHIESRTGETLFVESVVTEADDEEQKSTDRGPLDDDKIETALKKKAKDTGVPIGIIRAVMRRGLAAWKSGHRPGANQQQWGYARVIQFEESGQGGDVKVHIESRTGETLFVESVVTEADDEEQKSTDRGPLDDDKIETALKKKAKDTGVPIGIIRAVMRRGLAAWKSGHRPGANQQQWGYARVNAFLTKGEGTWGKADKDLAKEVRDGGHDKKLKKA